MAAPTIAVQIQMKRSRRLPTPLPMGLALDSASDHTFDNEKESAFADPFAYGISP